jgi:hypothetical protein
MGFLFSELFWGVGLLFRSYVGGKSSERENKK